jgi:3-oxoadipate enol-lactonase
VLRYDSRGHGASDVPPGPYTIEMLGQDALATDTPDQEP